ncbi:protein RarD [Marmoricola endophyticus]|uniref:Protein RarD n=1 Tax=Marmoricola endophyticus TaxID=2040280 RepID=A0A917F579_9ACTN|nr:EamA family transporter RarD [Marmoricola endophyticus]GGF51338.1 protein RarD [Marmoricola endophyticus]
MTATDTPRAASGTSPGTLRDEGRTGFLLGAAAYGLWGVFPIYWTLMEPVGAIELLAHRIAWSLITMLVLLVALRRTTHLRAILRDRRKVALLSVAAVVIAVNWGGFIWGVNNGHVVETSLGYFINPLVTVLMGVLLLGERLRRAQWVAMGVALVAVLVISVEYGRLPWIALLLAFSFGSYGLAKKKAGAEAIESLTFETVLLFPIAVGYIVWLQATGDGHFTSEGTGHALLFASTGIVTAIPLLCFGAAAIRVPMTVLGLLQYVTPICQFVLGIVVFGEDMPLGRWLGFVLVWVALAIFTGEAVRHGRHRRRQLALSAESVA